MSEKMSRRDFLKAALVAVGVVVTNELPAWVELDDDELFNELVEICTEQLEPEEVLDVLESEDLQDALGAVFGFLIEKGIEPEAYLIMKDFLE
jgi:hypothetical protein